jgi:hypothetical protein
MASKPDAVAYRADGHGHASYEPSMMVSLLLYAFAIKQRSSRAIGRRGREDVAYRVITGESDFLIMRRSRGSWARHERGAGGVVR